MPTITATHEFDNRLRVLIINGEVTEDEILECLPHPDQPGAHDLTLWDFTSGALGFTPDESGGLFVPEMCSGSRNAFPGKTGLVCPNELDHGVFRLLRVFAPRLQYPDQVRPFRNMRAARRWLGACKLCVQQIPSEKVRSKPCIQHCTRQRAASLERVNRKISFQP